MLGPLFKLRAFFAKQVSQDFMHSFLGLMALGNHPVQHRATPASSIGLGLSEAGDAEGMRAAKRLGDFVQIE